eukprot:TRINITY_DN430_c0_g3_i2.p2 TRINITY_DN430_c0_g3~~TRINITY_DN430_c0_g3_i2.p2  ORF type:complete len:182 (+),score=38.59 TRINITY_DN430_c0_g3_i2:552-1097(+)
MSLAEEDIGPVVVALGGDEKKKRYERNARFKLINKMAKANSSITNEKSLGKLEETPQINDQKEISKDNLHALTKSNKDMITTNSKGEILGDNTKTVAPEEAIKDNIEISLKDTKTEKEDIEESKNGKMEEGKKQPESESMIDKIGEIPNGEAILFASLLSSTETPFALLKEILQRYSFSLL